MKKFVMSFLFIVNLSFLCAQSENLEIIKNHTDPVLKTTLDNGLTLLVCPRHDVSTVSVQLWYNVGSKHEKDGERGIAHFIEHMIFKGTQKISETDIPLITSKLSGYCNAFTSYDYTAYIFDIPVENWNKVLPVMADCMSNCTLRQDHLNSELKAVIQELKMGKDNYSRSLWLTMITDIFESHPYHYSTIGFKQDLWTVSQESLLAFYKKYYTPDNAVMVIVGNVDPEKVHQEIEKEFGAIPAGNGWNTQKFYMNEDVKAKSVTLYRDVQQSVCDIAYVMPGITTENLFELEAFGYVLANGKGSRLHKLLVDDLQLVVDVHAFVADLFDHSMFFVEFYPKNESDMQKIVDLIQQEIDSIAHGNITLQEVERAQRLVCIDYQKNIQKTQSQAEMIGKSYLANKNHLYAFSYGNIAIDELAQSIQSLAANYCLPVVRHQGSVLAIPENYKALLAGLQKKSDEEDTLFLSAKVRTSPIEDPLYALTMQLDQKKFSNYAQPQTTTLENGLDVSWFHNPSCDIVECRLSLLADSSYDADDKQGLSFVMSKMLLEGTKNYPGKAFCDALEMYGISMSIAPGSISFTCLQQDVEKALLLLAEMITNVFITEQALEKVKQQVAMEAKFFWDAPTTYGIEIARQTIYKNHPYSKTIFGSEETLQSITTQDCRAWHKNMVSPCGAHLAIVGNFAHKNIQEIIEKTIGVWQGLPVCHLEYPALKVLTKQEINLPAQRDQIVLMFAGLSVDRMHEDYDKILLFDQILTGSALRSMDTRLFKVRMQTGLFYTIGGSLLFGATEQPGMIFIKTIVSGDRVLEAEKVILQVLDEAINTITEEELQAAKRSIITSFDMGYELNRDKIATFAFLKKYNLPADYFTTRAEALQHITIEQVQQAVRKILSSEKLAVIKIGRV